MERSTGQRFFVGCCALAALGLLGETLWAGQIIQCTGADGRVYFTDVGCPVDHGRDGVIGDTHFSDDPAQGPYRSSGYGYVERGNSVIEQAERMEARRAQIRHRQALEYQRWRAEQGPGYWDQTAARNAMVGVDKPRNAAELAIQYNAKSVAGGGTHQVRVPDVYESHIHSYNPRPHIRPCAGPHDFNCIRRR